MGKGKKNKAFSQGSSSAGQSFPPQRRKKEPHTMRQKAAILYIVLGKGVPAEKQREPSFWRSGGVTHEKQNWPGGSKFNSGGPNSSCPLSLFPHLPSFLPPAIPREGKGGTGRTLTDGDSP